MLLNVLFLSELFYPHGGGAEYATYQYARLLSQHNVNVTVVTNQFASEPTFSKRDGFSIYRFPMLHGTSGVKFQMLFNSDTWLSSALRKLVAWSDVVYIPRLWYSAIPVAKAAKKPVLVHLHDYVLVCPISSLYNFTTDAPCNLTHCTQNCILAYEQVNGRNLPNTAASTVLNSLFGRQFHRLIRQTDAFICVSNAQKTILTTKLPHLKNKTFVVYNPMPTLPQTSISGSDLGYLGGPNPAKGFSVLASAFTKTANCPVKLHATNFAVAGQKTGYPKVEFYRKLNPTQLDTFYTQIQTLIFPSICPEPLPYVVSEAVLRGRLVIASDTGGVPELLSGCKGTFLFEPGNSSVLTQKIDAACGFSREAAADLAAHDRSIFLQRFNNEQALTQFMGICEKLSHNN